MYGKYSKAIRLYIKKFNKNMKGLFGKGKLTDNFIDILQNYYGIANCSIVADIENNQS